VVDDDARIRGLLGQFLRRQGFFVTAVESAARARALLAGLSFDLVVLDVMMPGEDGLSLCRHLRRKLGLPVLLLTARGETGDRIAGLEAGADDYLPKPFDPKELVLRVNAILRRVAPPEPPPPPRGRAIRLGGALFDPERGEIVADGLPPTRLTATEAELMRVLAAEPGATVSRQRLVEEMARGPGRGLSTPAQERAVDVQITRLRRKIEPDPRQPRFLQTVRGAGYRLQPD
jgi:two-component system phosphate regulon response regulator OmpR